MSLPLYEHMSKKCRMFKWRTRSRNAGRGRRIEICNRESNRNRGGDFIVKYCAGGNHRHVFPRRARCVLQTEITVLASAGMSCPVDAACAFLCNRSEQLAEKGIGAKEAARCSRCADMSRKRCGYRKHASCAYGGLEAEHERPDEQNFHMAKTRVHRSALYRSPRAVSR